MLNKNGERELVYAVYIDDIKPIEGADRVEVAVVGGWRVMVRKGQFAIGDPAIYFEIDSKVPETEPFEFLAQKHYKIKTQKYFKGTVISQGLLMSAEDFGWTIDSAQFAGGFLYIVDDKGKQHIPTDENTMFLTEQLGVKYSVEEDNKRKAKSNPDAKINAALARHPKIAKKYGKIIKKNKFLRWAFLLIFGRKKDVRSWPGHIASKTDVERVQNMIWVLEDKQPYVATEKIDGSSFSVMAERTRFGKIKYYVCSRNVVFEDENQKCYYDENIYFEAYKKYDMKEKITQIMNDYNLQNVAIQSEIYGPSVQKRDYTLSKRKMGVFHIVSNNEKFPMDKVVEICDKYGLPHVPIIDDNYILPDTIEELQKFVESEGSKIDGKEKEGIVFYDKATGKQYFKFVSPNFLIKYHQ
jgi:hypothetical protein